MEDYIRDMWGGPGHLRFYLQPILAMLLALRDGRNDAKAGRPPYLFALLTDRALRKNRMGELVKRLAIPLVLALAMDFIFQLVIRGTWRPGASVIYAAFFVALPYSAVRGLTNRLSRRSVRRHAEA
ncbi:MAG TPA: hypothetical protein VIG99_25865 [Myxococcaceae bacterium]|jgi:hypothetical protein